MSETVKLIIEMPKETYEYWKTHKDEYVLAEAIGKGVLLDDIKAEIAEEIYLTDNPYTNETRYTIEYSKLLEIFDSIGKGE